MCRETPGYEGAEPALPVSQESWYEAACVPWHPFRHGQRSWEQRWTLERITLQVEVWQAPTVYSTAWRAWRNDSREEGRPRTR
jgi:hypothetical protein